MSGAEEDGHCGGGEDEAGGGGLPRSPQQGEGALGHRQGTWLIDADLGALLACDIYLKKTYNFG